MGNILSGLVLVNNTDIWVKYGAYLTEKKKGGRDNMKAILRASKVKEHIAVNIREENGRKYPTALTVVNDEREVSLYFALVADSTTEWWQKYREFIQFLKQGSNGWLDVKFPTLGITLRMFYLDCSDVEPLSDLWNEGKTKKASRFKVKFKEPNPIL
ncbi:MAG: hypothetical protein IJB01_09560 [Bacteroidaceae bacterium]|jgi:hypothetical protein|nr:hypothetical protein [Bacteroidaceae bacterium]